MKVVENNISVVSELRTGCFLKTIVSLYEEVEFQVYDSNMRTYIRKLKLRGQT